MQRIFYLSAFVHRCSLNPFTLLPGQTARPHFPGFTSGWSRDWGPDNRIRVEVRCASLKSDLQKTCHASLHPITQNASWMLRIQWRAKGLEEMVGPWEDGTWVPKSPYRKLSTQYLLSTVKRLRNILFLHITHYFQIYIIVVYAALLFQFLDSRFLQFRVPVEVNFS